MFRSMFIRIAFVLISAIAIPTFAGGGSVAVIEADLPGTPSPTMGEQWCALIESDGYTCTLFPRSGPSSSLDPFDVVVDLSTGLGGWADPAGSLPDFLRAGKTVVVWGYSPIPLGIESNPQVRAWIGADHLQNGNDELVTVALDPILGDLPLETELHFCGDGPCAALTGTEGHGGVKVVARYSGGGNGVVGIQRNYWEGGTSIFFTEHIRPGPDPNHEMIILNSLRPLPTTIPTLSQGSLASMALLLVACAIVLIRRRSGHFPGAQSTKLVPGFSGGEGLPCYEKRSLESRFL